MILSNPIGWCDDTGNKVIGCAKVSEGCKLCYAMNDTPARVHRHRGIETWGPNGVRIPVLNFSEKTRRLNKLCICDDCGKTHPFSLLSEGVCLEPLCVGPLRRIRLFANSNSDWLDEQWSTETLASFLWDIHSAPNIDFLLLTKRPENAMNQLFTARQASFLGQRPMISDWLEGKPPANVWFGVSVENNDYRWRIEEMFKLKCHRYFVSAEPLLGPLDLKAWLMWKPKLHWVITGGESGTEKQQPRACDVQWILDLGAQCAEHGVPFYPKQLGSNCITPNVNLHRWPPGVRVMEVAGATRVTMPGDKSGTDTFGWPDELLQFKRQFPN